MTDPLLTLGGQTRGVVSVCVAHPEVIAAALEEAMATGKPAVIEATCNQVNHRGGYTGMTPADYVAETRAIARRVGYPEDAIIFGGDHLGPNPWRHLPADEAMAEARAMMAAFAEAGYRKLHLDCSMGCAGEPVALDDETTAARAAELCAVAESVGSDFVYIIGTEIPTPGGAHEALAELRPTTPDAVRTTYAVHRRRFAEAGLSAALDRVIAIVVQPGVEFEQTTLAIYDPDKARDLVAARDDLPGLVYEAHSSDYQTEAALNALVRDGFAILKIGPSLTYALRETLYGLEMASAEIDGGPRRLYDTLERLMLADPAALKGHQHGTPAEQRLQRHYGLNDRVRYYWPEPDAAAEVAALLERYRRLKPPLGLLSQYVSGKLLKEALEAGDDLADGLALVRRAVRRSLRPWYEACR